MIKINNSWIDEDEISSLHKDDIYKDKDNKEYEIRIHTKNNSYYPINFYSNLQLRDIEFDKLADLLVKKGKKDDDNKDYIQGFKDGTEYALKLSSKAN